MIINLNKKSIMGILLTFLALTDLSIIFNLPFLRQIFGFLFLTILPGFLLINSFKNLKCNNLEKFLLTVGLSIFIILIFSLIINNTLLFYNYTNPLSKNIILIALNLLFIIHGFINYAFINNDLELNIQIKLNNVERIVLIIGFLLPTMCIVGSYLLNIYSSNILVMFLFLLIVVNVCLISLFNKDIKNSTHIISIFLISISLILLLALRSNYILGIDTAFEFQLYEITLNNQHWMVSGHNPIDSCIIISILPTVYYQLIGVSHVYIFKIIYAVFFSFAPLIIYVISNRYLDRKFAFLASIYFIFQLTFLWAVANARTSIAILFFMLTIMVLFSEIDILKKRLLTIIFIIGCILSHYSTSYIFFIIILFTSIISFLGEFVTKKVSKLKSYHINLPNKSSHNIKLYTINLSILFLILIFLWYSQLTPSSEDSTFSFIKNTVYNVLSNFFLIESRGQAKELLGVAIEQKGIAHQIEFFFTWLIIAVIGVGIINSIMNYKKMLNIDQYHKKLFFLKKKIDVEYFIMAMISCGLLLSMVILPYIAVGYDMTRLYSTVTVVLAVFFMIGSITISSYLYKLYLLIKKSKNNLKHEKSKVLKTSIVITLLILVPYFFSISGVTYNIFNSPRSIFLNTEGEQYDQYYIHDQEVYGMNWLKANYDNSKFIYADHNGFYQLISIGFPVNRINPTTSSLGNVYKNKNGNIDGYIYLRYFNTIKKKLLTDKVDPITEYPKIFEKNKLYDDGMAEIYV